MKARLLLLVLATTMSLGACSWFKGPRGPQPSPLPKVTSGVGLTQAWQIKLGETKGTLLRPAVHENNIYAGGQDGTLVRVNEAGKEVWRAKSVAGLTGGVATDGNLVAVGSSDGVLAVHDARSGVLLWQVPVIGELGGTPFVSGGTVVARVGDSTLIAFSAQDGKRLWTYQRTQSPLSLRSYSGISRSGDLLLAGFPGGKLVALTLVGGFPRWETSVAAPRGSNELERMADVAGDPELHGDKICVAAYQGRIACLEREKGGLLWTRDYSSALGVVSGGKTIAFTDASGVVYLLDAQTGATIWKQSLLQYRGVGRPLVLGAGHVAVADRQGWIHVLDAENGQFIGQMNADSSGVVAPMLLLSKNMFVVQAQDGALLAISVRE